MDGMLLQCRAGQKSWLLPIWLLGFSVHRLRTPSTSTSRDGASTAFGTAVYLFVNS